MGVHRLVFFSATRANVSAPCIQFINPKGCLPKNLKFDNFTVPNKNEMTKYAKQDIEANRNEDTMRLLVSKLNKKLEEVSLGG